MKKIIIAIGLGTLLLFSTAARKHSNISIGGPGDSITIDQTAPVRGDTVTFTTTGTGTNITVGCYQDVVGLVYAARQDVGTAFTLSWASGSADCYAWLDNDLDLSNGFLAVDLFAVGG